MGSALLYDNFVTSAAQLTASSYATAQLSGITKTQAGSVVFEIQGQYTGVLETDYVVQIQTAGVNGNFAGTTYRWRTSASSTWVQENLTPVASTWVNLNNGVQIRFSPGVSLPYFVSSDSWQFRAIRKYGIDKLIDLNRDTEFRSEAVSDGSTLDLTMDLGTAKTPLALVLTDHNLIATTSMRLQGSSLSTFGSLTFDQLVTWQAQKRCFFPAVPVSAQYWRLRITAGPGQGEIRLSEVYLGSRVTLFPAFRQGYTRRRVRLGSQQDASRLAHGQGVAVLDAETYDLTFGQRRAGVTGDLVKLEALWVAINDWASGDLKPFYFVPNDADLSTFGLYHWANDYEEPNRVDGVSDINWQLVAVSRSLV